MTDDGTPSGAPPDQLRALGGGIRPIYDAPAGGATTNSQLRPHQVRLIDAIDRQLSGGPRHIVMQAPTGFGKTLVAATYARRCIEERKRLLFTVPALSLIDQTVGRFHAAGVYDVGVIQADHPLTNFARPIQIASVQTLARRQMPPVDIVIVDEVHRWFDTYAKWLNGPWRHLPVIGMSATPSTKGLGKHFSNIVIGSTTEELITGGYLSKFRVFAPASPDLTGVRIIAGDFQSDDLSKAMDRASLVADVVDTWLDRGGGRPTLCFAVDRAHAKHLQQKFMEAGTPAGYVDHYTDGAERKEIERQFHAGEIKVVVNVACLTTGIDWDVRCIVLARPTRSEILFVQMIGRGLRAAHGKSDCLILDHSDNHTRLGFVTDIPFGFLDDGRARPKAEPKTRELLPKKCPKCTYLRPPKFVECPACGFIPVPQNKVQTVNGELVEMKSRNAAVPVDAAMFYRELKHYALECRYQSGWIAHKFKEKFGHWPNGLDHLTPIVPSRTTLGWIRSRQIAYAKAQAKGA